MSYLFRLQVALKPWLPLLLRLGLGFIFLWSGLSKFGLDQNSIGVCTNRAEAISLVSTYSWLPFDPEIFVTVQSIGEIILGLLLVLGLWVELAGLASSLLFVLFFLLINFSLVWKNVALLAAALAIFGSGADEFSLDHWLKKKRSPPALEQW